MSSIDWANELRKVDPTKSSYWYEECEKAAINVKCGSDWVLLKRDEEDNYQGTTELIIQDKDGNFFECNYYWGSCSGCDTLQGEGEEAACQMIYDEIKPRTTDQTNCTEPTTQ